MMERWIIAAALCASSACQYYDGPGHREHAEPCDDAGSPDAGERAPDATLEVPDGSAPEIPDGGVSAPDAGEPPMRCVEDAECPDLSVCVEGACTPLEDACRIRADCGPGRACVDNACRPVCADDAACAHGTSCVDGSCQPTSECAVSRDCSAGYECVESRCLVACRADSECGDDARCDEAGVCRPDVRPRPFCLDDSECADGHLCVDGVCRTPCPSQTDEECQRWDTQLVLCAEPEAGLHLCYTRAEANPECVTRAECASTEHCIDGLCR